MACVLAPFPGAEGAWSPLDNVSQETLEEALEDALDNEFAKSGSPSLSFTRKRQEGKPEHPQKGPLALVRGTSALPHLGQA